jgi:16S rRNA (guanine966-N2)-methyltransferase
VRVIAGELRGRRLVAPRGTGTRPTSDRVREATFNALGSLDAIDGAAVLDAFAGSGAMGIEALSRGAARCTFVERDREALVALRANLDACRLGPDRAVVVVGDGAQYRSERSGRFDLALLDPPYAFDGWDDLLDALDAGIAVCESGRPIDPPAGWRLARSKAYGGTVVSIVVNEVADPWFDATTEGHA